MKYLTIPVALFALLISAPSAHACSVLAGSLPTTPQEAAVNSDLVFAGTVTSIVQDKSVDGAYRISFAVESVYKGEASKTVRITTQSSSAACGYDDGYKKFAVGTVWAIYASGSETEGYATNSLTLNTSYPNLAAATATLDAAFGKSITGTNPSLPMRDVAIGARGSEVLSLQKYLIEQNVGVSVAALRTAGATGYFGSMTRAALAEFQAKNGIFPAAGYYGPKTRAFMSARPTASAVTFTGKLESVDTSCFSDGICSATVGGKKVIVLAGYRINPPPVGSITGVESIGDLEGKIRKTVQVFAAPSTDSGYDFTLYGDTDYYLRVTEIGKNVSYTGTIGCRAPKATEGMTIALCAFGLKTDSGTYYALSDASGTQNIAGYEDSQKVKVTGTLAPAPDDSFQAEATIVVTKIEKSS